METSKNSNHKNDLVKLSNEELSVLFSNLAKAGEKQYKTMEMSYFTELSDYYFKKSEEITTNNLSSIAKELDKNLKSQYNEANNISSEKGDRGALRALLWGEKVSKITSSILKRYEKNKEDFLKDKDIYVCEICGFIYIGNASPDICPVCKVPGLKIRKLQKEVF